LAKSSLELNDPRRCEGSLKKAMSLDPGGSEPLLLHGYLRLKENKLDEALASFRKASAINPDDTVSLCMIGYVLERQGKSVEAMDCYAKALKRQPNDELASKLMADLHLEE
jgi:Tfp pilus assembly protein PilF